MVTYQFQIPDETWNEWKDTVPRSKSLDTRLIELIEADTEGRINPPEMPRCPECHNEISDSEDSRAEYVCPTYKIYYNEDDIYYDE